MQPAEGFAVAHHAWYTSDLKPYTRNNWRKVNIFGMKTAHQKPETLNPSSEVFQMGSDRKRLLDIQSLVMFQCGTEGKLCASLQWTAEWFTFTLLMSVAQWESRWIDMSERRSSTQSR